MVLTYSSIVGIVQISLYWLSAMLLVSILLLGIFLYSSILRMYPSMGDISILFSDLVEKPFHAGFLGGEGSK